MKKVAWKEKRVVGRDGRSWGYDRLISSLPLPFLTTCMEPELPEDLRKAAGRLEHNAVYAVNLAVAREEISPYHWIYFPEREYILHRVSFPKNFSASMAPDGWSSIIAEVSASKYREAPSQNGLIKRVLADLRETQILKDTDVVKVKSVLNLNPAYVIYTHSHRSSVDSLHQFLRDNDIYPCGRFGEWEYLNMDHSILSGKKAAIG
jgi:UDP-galactopyranose mutase